MVTVVVVGSQDNRLQQMLTAAGMAARSMDVAGLASIGRGGGMPDVIVIDRRADPGIPVGLSVVRRTHPNLGVVIVASTLDPTLLLEAMRAGVNELVAEPLTKDDLQRAVARVLVQRPQGETGRVFGFVGAKGGVGTTTVAVNVAGALSRLDPGTRTLLVDLHQAGGDAAVFTGVDPKFSILDAIENTHRLDQSYLSGLVTEVASQLDLLASSERPFAGQVDPAKIRAVLAFVAGLYTYVVLDMPRSDASVLDALDESAAIFVVANQELATVKSGTRVAATLRQRYGRERVKVILSRSDRQADIGVSDVERVIGGDIAHTFPSDYRVAVQALNRGRPLVFDEDNDLASSFQRFANGLAGRKRENKVSKGGLLGRLTRS